MLLFDWNGQLDAGNFLGDLVEGDMLNFYGTQYTVKKGYIKSYKIEWDTKTYKVLDKSIMKFLDEKESDSIDVVKQHELTIAQHMSFSFLDKMEYIEEIENESERDALLDNFYEVVDSATDEFLMRIFDIRPYEFTSNKNEAAIDTEVLYIEEVED